MFRRQSAWNILTASLIGLSTTAACGGDSPAKPSDKHVAAAPAMPSIAQRDSNLTSVQPTAPVEPAPVKTAASEPAPVEAAAGKAKAASSSEELLDRLALAARRKPDDVRAHVALARGLFDAGKLSEARDAAEQATQLDDSSGAAWYILGRIQMGQSQIEDAATSFENAVEHDQDNSYAWNNLGYVYIQQGQWDKAAAALENATSGAKPTGYMWNNLGMAYEHLDRIREARAAYRQAAAAGSDKGSANLVRLEGVVSLVLDENGNSVDPEGDAADVAGQEVEPE